MFEKFKEKFGKEKSSEAQTPDTLKDQIKSREDRIAEVNAQRKMSGASTPQSNAFDDALISKYEREITELRGQLPPEPETTPPTDGGERSNVIDIESVRPITPNPEELPETQDERKIS